MRGQILGVDTRTGDGLVAGEDGRRYRFRPDDWADRGEPAVGLEVDFEAAEQRALNLFPVPGSGGVPQVRAMAATPAPRHDRSKIVAALLAFFLGPLGIHRFYTGRIGSGLVMLVLTIMVVGLIITVPWSWIDTFRYLTMTNGEFDRRYAED